MRPMWLLNCDMPILGSRATRAQHSGKLPTIVSGRAYGRVPEAMGRRFCAKARSSSTSCFRG
jgi:hypothetical protein